MFRRAAVLVAPMAAVAAFTLITAAAAAATVHRLVTRTAASHAIAGVHITDLRTTLDPVGKVYIRTVVKGPRPAQVSWSAECDSQFSSGAYRTRSAKARYLQLPVANPHQCVLTVRGMTTRGKITMRVYEVGG